MEASSETHQYLVKLKCLLDNALLKQNFSVNLKSLLSHFSRCENKGITNLLCKLDLFTEWIIEACSFWEANEDVQPSIDLGCFVFELVTLVSKNEERFLQLCSGNAYLRLCDTFRVRKCGCSTEIKLAYVKMLESFLEHKRGVVWIRATSSWIDILNYCLGNKCTNDLIKTSYNFMYKLLENRICYDEAFCKVVAKRITQPFLLNTISNIDKDILKTKIIPTSELIIAIMELYLKNECNLQRFKHIPRIFFADCNLLEIATTYIRSLEDEEYISNFSNIISLIYFITLSINCKEYMITEYESTTFFEKVFLLIEDAINKSHYNNMLRLCSLAIKYYSLIETRLLPLTEIKDVQKNPMNFQNQCAVLQMLPVIEYVEKDWKVDWNLLGVEELRDGIIQQWWGKLCEYSLRLIYGYLKTRATNSSKRSELGLNAINYITKSSKYYEQETAIAPFQTLLYMLHDGAAIAKENRILLETLKQNTDILIALLCAIKTLIENHDIRWGKSVMESVCVVNAVVDFLLLNSWPAKVTIQALILLKLSIEKYMTPNLTLLLDRTSDSSLGQLGPVLLSKLEDMDWEIRKNSLEVVTTISELSHSKFPSFQDLLHEEHFPPLVLKLCEADSESIVRASALKCLQQMIKGDVLWNEFFEKQELLDKTINILNRENECVIRKEATILLHQLYITQRFEERKLPGIYKIMSTIAKTDPNEEVRRNAIEFWDKVVWECLKDQGMIDGEFPEVTFSKQHKKIVTLNKEEIKKRLYTTIDELNTNGCLEVLIETVQHDSDIEVSETAVRVARTFIELLSKYGVSQNSNDNINHKKFSEKLNEALENKKVSRSNANCLNVVLKDMIKELEQ